MSNDMYLPALPAIGDEFLASDRLIQLTIASWFGGATFVQLIVGPLSDRYGRRLILFGGGILFLLSTLGCALVPSIFLLILLRFIQGIGVCTMMVAGYAAVHDLYEDTQAIHILAWMGSAAVIAPAIGPLLGGFILLFGDWRIIFLCLFAIGIVSLLCLWFAMPGKRSLAARAPFEIKHLLRSYKNLFSNRNFLSSSFSFSLAYAGMIGWIAASPFLLIDTLGLTPYEFGWVQVPVFSSYILGALIIKRMLEKVGTEKLISLGLTISAVSALFLLIFSLFAPGNLWTLLLSMSGYSIGFGMASAPLNRMTLTATNEKKGAAIAIFYLTMEGMATVISSILSLFEETFLTASILICTFILFSLFLHWTRSRLRK